MSEIKKKKQSFKKGLIVTSLNLAIALLILLFATISVISIPAIQTGITNRITEAFKREYDIDIQIGYINFQWFDVLVVRDLLVIDPEGHHMVKAKTATIDLSFAGLFQGDITYLDQINLKNARVSLVKNGPDGLLNMTNLIRSIKNSLPERNPDKKRKEFAINRIKIKNTIFSFNKNAADPKVYAKGEFNPEHFTVDGINADLNAFLVDTSSNITFHINELVGQDSASSLEIQQLESDFLYSPTQMSFLDSDLQTGSSVLKGDINFLYFQNSSLSHFLDSVTIDGDLSNSLLKLSDLSPFVPRFESMDFSFDFDIKAKGLVGNLNVKEFSIKDKKGTNILGNGEFYGLPKVQETLMILDIKKGRITPGTYKSFVDSTTYANLDKLGNIKFAGEFSGFINDFVSNGSFDTKLGSFSTDLNLKINEKDRLLSNYKGQLKTPGFDIGPILNDTANFGLVIMDGLIQGKGLTVKTADFVLKAKFNNFEANKYDYRDLLVNARLSSEIFNGSLKVNDPNLIIDSYAEIDLREESKSIRLKADLDTVNFLPLNFSKKDIALKSQLYINTINLHPDSLKGSLYFNNTNISVEDRSLMVEKFQLRSEIDTLSRSINFESPFFNFNVFGDFKITKLLPDMIDNVKDYFVILENDPETVLSHYEAKSSLAKEYYFLDYEFDVMNVNPLFDLFLPGVSMSEDFKIIGSYTGGNNTIVELFTDFDQIIYDKNQFNANSITLSASIIGDTANIDATAYVSTDEYISKAGLKAKNLSMDIDWNDRQIYFLTKGSSANDQNSVFLSGDVLLENLQTRVHINQSEILAVGEKWAFLPNNEIIIKPNDFEFINVNIQSKDQELNLNGRISNDPDENLFLAINNFELQNLNAISQKEYKGVLNGFVDIKDYFNENIINSRLTVRNFSFNNFLMGDISSIISYDSYKKIFNIGANVTLDNVKTIDIIGVVNPKDTQENINLSGTLNNTDISILEPFFEKYIENLHGIANGNVSVIGTFDDLGLYGNGSIDGGELLFKYFNTNYIFNGDVTFDNHLLKIEQVELVDPYLNSAYLSGDITHNFFNDLVFDLEGNFTELQLVSLPEDLNSLYYGEAYGTGTISMKGEAKNLFVDVKAKTEKGTRIYIPLNSSGEVTQSEFIQFVQIQDTITLENVQEKVKPIEIGGVDVNLDIQATPDAQIDIIFDMVAGDIIRGRGNGELNMRVSSLGDFSMYGDYYIESGGYNFTMYNIINKEFSILPESKISWIGDPYSAILDIKAAYSQLVSLTPIFQNITQEEIDGNPALKKKFPADVLLDIQGNLEGPEISFDIDIHDYPKNLQANNVSYDNHVTIFENRIRSDEQYLNQQVFSLILLRSLSADQNTIASGTNTVNSSMSEFISNQFSYWINQFDENLEVNIDLGEFTQDQLNTMQLRLSYTFMEGRLRVTRDGGFTNTENQTDARSVLGDWSVEYSLTPDNKLRAKVYNQTNFNRDRLSGVNLSGSYTTTGLSLTYTQSFEDINRLVRRAIEKQQEFNLTTDSLKINPTYDSTRAGANF